MNNKIDRNRKDIAELKKEEKEYVKLDQKRTNCGDYKETTQESKHYNNHSNIGEKETKKLYYNQNLDFLRELIENERGA